MEHLLKEINEQEVLSSNNMDNVCNKIIHYCSINKDFNQKLEDENSKEFLLFNLAVMYGDRDFEDERHEIEKKILDMLKS